MDLGIHRKNQKGFTIPEVLTAATIMVILCVGTLSVFSYVIKLNRGNNLKMQALSVLQREVEDFRSFKFIPTGSDTRLNAGTYATYKTGVQSTCAFSPCRTFNISVTIVNVDTLDDANTKFKQITISAVPQVEDTEVWLKNNKLGTSVTVQRVRSAG
jgi:prepilin-type N-terminal cleavage/methylation domain-containing protein